MTGHINLNFKTFTFKQLRKPLAGKVFVVACFRMRVNIARGSLIDWKALLDKRFDDLFGDSVVMTVGFLFEGMDADAFWEPCSAFRYAPKTLQMNEAQNRPAQQRRSGRLNAAAKKHRTVLF